MSQPDSEAWEGQAVRVGGTPKRDNPKYGAVTLFFDTSPNTSNSIRITRSTAHELNKQLTEYLKESK